MPDDPHLLRLRRMVGTPVVEQVVDDRVQPIRRRIPRLDQVVVEPDVVDGLDRDVGVGIRRQQQQLGVR